MLVPQPQCDRNYDYSNHSNYGKYNVTVATIATTVQNHEVYITPSPSLYKIYVVLEKLYFNLYTILKNQISTRPKMSTMYA